MRVRAYPPSSRGLTPSPRLAFTLTQTLTLTLTLTQTQTQTQTVRTNHGAASIDRGTGASIDRDDPIATLGIDNRPGTAG